MAGETASQVSELRKLFGRATTEKYFDRDVELRPFEFEQLDLVLEIAEPFIADLIAPDASRLEVYRKHKGPVIALMGLLSGQDEAWIRKLPAFEALRLFTDCLLVNGDFFSQGLSQLSYLMGLLPRAEAKSSSSAQATPSEQPPAADPAAANGSSAGSSSATGSSSPNV